MMGLLAGTNYNDIYGNYAKALQGISTSYDPWSQGGLSDFQTASRVAQMNAANPQHAVNQLSSSFQNSPYQQNLLNQTQQQLASNAAQTGMLGSQTANLQLANQMNDMTGQFQNQYINQGLGVMNQALNTLSSSLSPQGLKALSSGNAYQQMAAQAQLQGALAQANQKQDMFGDITGLALNLAPMAFGMPPGMLGAASTMGATGGLGASMGGR